MLLYVMIYLLFTCIMQHAIFRAHRRGSASDNEWDLINKGSCLLIIMHMTGVLSG